MTKQGGGRGWARTLGLWRVCVLFLGVSVTISYLALKVELADVAREAERCQARIAALKEERAKLNAAVVFRQKPGAIERIARGELGMEYPAGRLSDIGVVSRQLEGIQ